MYKILFRFLRPVHLSLSSPSVHQAAYLFDLSNRYNTPFQCHRLHPNRPYQDAPSAIDIAEINKTIAPHIKSLSFNCSPNTVKAEAEDFLIYSQRNATQGANPSITFIHNFRKCLCAGGKIGHVHTLQGQVKMGINALFRSATAGFHSGYRHR